MLFSPAFSPATSSFVTWTLVDTATSSGSNQITIPSGALIGDVVLMMDGVFDGPSGGTPSNYTRISWHQDASFQVIEASYRKLVSSGSAVITGRNASFKTKSLLLLRPSSPIGTVYFGGASAGTGNAQSTVLNPTSQSVNAATILGNQPCVVVAAAFAYAATPSFSTESPSFTGGPLTPSDTYAQRCEWTIYASSPSDHTVDMNDLGGGNGLLSFYFAAEAA